MEDETLLDIIIRNPNDPIFPSVTTKRVVFMMVAVVVAPFLSFFVTSLLPFSDNQLTYLSNLIAKAVPGLKGSLLNISHYRKSDDAAIFVISQLLGFILNSAIVITFILLYVIPSFYNRKLENAPPLNGSEITIGCGNNVQPPKPTLGQKLAAALMPLFFGLCFFFAPIAYVPGPGTAASKAFQGSILMANLISVFWGVFLFLWLIRLFKALSGKHVS